MKFINVASKGDGVCMGHGPFGAPVMVKVFVLKGTKKFKIDGLGVLLEGQKVTTTCPVCGRGMVTKGSKRVKVSGRGVAKNLPMPSIRLFGAPGSKVFYLKTMNKKATLPIM